MDQILKGRRHKTSVMIVLLAVITLSAVSIINIVSMDPVDPYDYRALVTSAIPNSNDEVFATGAERMTEAEEETERKTSAKLKKVKLNKIGLERVNENLLSKGERPVKPEKLAKFGNEIESVIGEEDAPGATVEEDSAFSGELAVSVLPHYVDNSVLKYFPPIGHQGSQNSCAAWATIYYAATHMYNMVHDYDAKAGGTAYRFSPKWTYNMANGGSNVGTYPSASYNMATKNGLATMAECPYNTDYRGWCTGSTVWGNAVSRRMNQYGYINGMNTETGLSQAKQLLLNGYVLNYSTYINSWIYSTIKNDPSTALDDSFAGKRVVYKVAGTNGGHAMTIVGYNDEIWTDINANGLVDTGEKGAFRIANSWGTGWNEAGYSWLAYQAIRTPNSSRTSEGIFWSNQVTYITAKPAYEPRLIAEFTINQLSRKQVAITLGTSDLTRTTPSVSWTSAMINAQGGAYAFDGTTVAKDGTFIFDLTHLIPADGSMRRYYVNLRDNAAGNVSTFISGKIIDLENSITIPLKTLPQVTDANQIYTYADYQFGTQNLPVASITATPISGISPLIVSFDGTNSSGIGASIVNYNWNFGDGSTGLGQIVSHTYVEAGTYTANLTVTDSNGRISNGTAVTITVLDNNVAPVASMSANPTTGTAPLTVEFGDNGSSDIDGEISSYSWNFGDGSAIVSGTTASHQYANAGTYTATLTVFDNKGAKGIVTKNIVVNPDPNNLIAPSTLQSSLNGNEVKLIWKDNTANEEGYYIERATKEKNSYPAYSIVGTVPANTISWTESVSKGTYSYRVKAYNSSLSKQSGYSATTEVKVVK